jgi:hypothetical protein
LSDELKKHFGEYNSVKVKSSEIGVRTEFYAAANKPRSRNKSSDQQVRELSIPANRHIFLED